MKLVNISYLEELPKDTDERIHQGHVRDEAAKGIVCNYKRFSIVAKNEQDEIIAALSAYTAFSEVYVDDIWVDPTYRRCGIGRHLLENLENRFMDKGYNNINLVTSEFTSASAFYRECGFELEFVRVNKHNPKLTKYFFIKFFTNENQYQGIVDKNPQKTN